MKTYKILEETRGKYVGRWLYTPSSKPMSSGQKAVAGLGKLTQERAAELCQEHNDEIFGSAI